MPNMLLKITEHTSKSALSCPPSLSNTLLAVFALLLRAELPELAIKKVNLNIRRNSDTAAENEWRPANVVFRDNFPFEGR